MTTHYTRDYREETVDRHGQPIVFRLVGPDDKTGILEGMKRMSPESRFLRFFSYRNHLTMTELRYLTELDYDDHFALAVGSLDAEGQEVGLGIARFVRIDPPHIAEAAVAVVDEAQGRGLGRMLFERLVRAANERNVTIFRFEVLAENDAMLGLVEALFPGTTTTLDDRIIILDCPLPNLTAVEPANLRDGLLYRVLRLAAAGSLAVLRGTNLSSQHSMTLKNQRDPEPFDDLASRIGVDEDDSPAPS